MLVPEARGVGGQGSPTRSALVCSSPTLPTRGAGCQRRRSSPYLCVNSQVALDHPQPQFPC
jgi:hypothetical protein